MLTPSVGDNAESSVSRRDKDEFVRLLGTHERYVRAYILSLLPSWADADEIFQETCLRLYQQIDEWDSTKSFRAWACAVAYFQVLSRRKVIQRERLRFGEDFMSAVARQHTAESMALDRRGEALESCLDKLNPERRQILEWFYRDDLSINQLAAKTGRTVAASYKTLLRTRNLLRDCIERSLLGTE
ncbi:MAG: sigma-70 family RNA polymerase sigma factor [Planctomycetaceae bacterium]